MIGLDTNVLLAWTVEGQSRALQAGETYRVSHIALMEYQWALAKRFRYRKDTVITALRQLLEASNLIVDRPEVVRAAIDDYASGGAEFTDFMIMRDNEAAGCRTTVTLDYDASRKPGFTHLRS